MISTRSTIRRHLGDSEPGLIVGAIIEHVDGRIHALAPDPYGRWSPGRGDLQHAIETVTHELNSTFYSPTPSASVDPLDWLVGIAADRRLTGAARRVAGIIADGEPGKWYGLVSIGNRVGMSKANAARSIENLIQHGHLKKTRHKGRAYYAIIIPGLAI